MYSNTHGLGKYHSGEPNKKSQKSKAPWNDEDEDLEDLSLDLDEDLGSLKDWDSDYESDSWDDDDF